MLFYRAALPLSRQALSFVAGIIRGHRAAIGSLWRKLNAGRQALLVLVHLRKGEPFAQVAGGFGVGTATAWRYVTETVALLAARAPKLRQAVRAATKAGYAFTVLDGTLIRTDRVAADRPFFSGKHHCHDPSCRSYPMTQALFISVFHAQKGVGSGDTVLVIHPSALPSGAGVQIGASVDGRAGDRGLHQVADGNQTVHQVAAPADNTVLRLGLVYASQQCTGS